VMDAMPSTNLKPEGEDEALVSDRIYRTTYMFRWLLEQQEMAVVSISVSSSLHAAGTSA